MNTRFAGASHLIRNKDLLYFGMLAVDPVQQSRGVGRFLLESAKEFTRSNGLSQINLTVLSTRQELIDWYTRSDFRIVQTNLPFPNT